MFKFASLASMSSKDFWFTVGMLAIVVLWDTTVPLWVFTVPGTILNISSLIAAKWASEHDGTALGSLGWFWGLVSCSMTLCCCSTRDDNLLISWFWAFISSACWRCIWDKIGTWSWCAISSSIILASCCSCNCSWAAWLFGSDCKVGPSSSLLIAWTICAHMAEYGRCTCPDYPPNYLWIVTGVDCFLLLCFLSLQRPL